MRSLLFALCAMLLFPRSAHAAGATTFEASGRAPISAGDRVRARQRAMDDAFSQSVSAAVSALLGPDVLARRAADMRLKILPRAKSYVTTFRILEEGELEPGMFVVRISAEVAADRLVSELSEKRPPQVSNGAPARIVLCVANPSAAPLERGDAALRTALTNRGLEVATALHCEDEEVLRVARSAAARAILIADWTSSPPSTIRGSALVGTEAKLGLRLLSVDGRHLGDAHSEAAGYGKTADIAAEEALLRALPSAMPAIERALDSSSSAVGKDGLVIVRVTGLRRVADLANLRAAFERLPGVEGAEPRRFLPGLPASVELGVRTTQSPHTIAEGLSRVATSNQLRVRETDGVVIVEMIDPSEVAPR